MLSTEKVPEAVHQLLAQAELPQPFGMMIPQLLPLAMGAMPEDPDVLDDALAQLAQQLLDLRTDHAIALGVLPLGGLTQEERAAAGAQLADELEAVSTDA